MAGIKSLSLANDSCFERRFQNMLEQSRGNLDQFHETKLIKRHPERHLKRREFVLNKFISV
jgi:hypothetical protein